MSDKIFDIETNNYALANNCVDEITQILIDHNLKHKKCEESLEEVYKCIMKYHISCLQNITK